MPLKSNVRPHKHFLMRSTVVSVAAIALLAQLFQASADAQTLPPPSRTVFKCEVNGKVVYSDEPCPGAKLVNVTPTRGLDKSSGTVRTGDDVRREKHNEVMSEALRPILNETPEQRAVRHRRFKLSEQAKAECRTLDLQIDGLQSQERGSTKSDVESVRQRLYKARVRHRELRC